MNEKAAQAFLRGCSISVLHRRYSQIGAEQARKVVGIVDAHVSADFLDGEIAESEVVASFFNPFDMNERGNRLPGFMLELVGQIWWLQAKMCCQTTL